MLQLSPQHRIFIVPFRQALVTYPNKALKHQIQGDKLLTTADFCMLHLFLK